MSGDVPESGNARRMAVIDQVAAESSDVLEQAAAELLATDKGFLFLYKRDKSALEHYQSRPSLQAFFNPYLEQHDPARFEAIRQHCSAQIAAVDAQIAALCDYEFTH